MIPVFRSGRVQLLKVRFVMLLALACGVAGAVGAVHLGQTYGLREADGGVLAPLQVRLAWGVGVGLLGGAFMLGMGLYGRCYVARMELDSETGTLCVHTVGFVGLIRHTYELSKIGGGRYYEGRLRVPRTVESVSGPSRLATLTVNAPWWTLRVRGRRLPLILDAQGEILDEVRFFELVRLTR